MAHLSWIVCRPAAGRTERGCGSVPRCARSARRPAASACAHQCSTHQRWRGRMRQMQARSRRGLGLSRGKWGATDRQDQEEYGDHCPCGWGDGREGVVLVVVVVPRAETTLRGIRARRHAPPTGSSLRNTAALSRRSERNHCRSTAAIRLAERAATRWHCAVMTVGGIVHSQRSGLK